MHPTLSIEPVKEGAPFMGRESHAIRIQDRTGLNTLTTVETHLHGGQGVQPCRQALYACHTELPMVLVGR